MLWASVFDSSSGANRHPTFMRNCIQKILLQTCVRTVVLNVELYIESKNKTFSNHRAAITNRPFKNKNVVSIRTLIFTAPIDIST